ncbi:MAG TPA: lysophospholipid acyltransferase family protein [Chloroflexia bacterium]|nr:lysophospholipid acyltransferase family protein [Chloroflexia bacterium]
MKQATKDKLIVKGYKVVSWLCWKVPTPVSYALADIGGDIYYWVARNHSRYADYNMQIVLGEPKINGRVRLVARHSFRNYVKYLVDFLRQPHMSAEEIMEHAVGVGWEYIDGALEEGKGLMLITPHFGNWDGAAAVVGGLGYTFSTVAKDFEPPELNELIQGARREKGAIIYSLKDSFRGLFSTIKKNGIVVLLLDSPLRNEGIVVNFFGKPARLASGPGTLVYRTGAKLVLGYMARQPDNRSYYGCWEPPLEYTLTGDHDEDIKAITQAIATAIEKVVRRHPDQWYMFRRLFLTDEEVAEHNRMELERTTGKIERRSRLKNNKVKENVTNQS